MTSGAPPAEVQGQTRWEQVVDDCGNVRSTNECCTARTSDTNDGSEINELRSTVCVRVLR